MKSRFEVTCVAGRWVIQGPLPEIWYGFNKGIVNTPTLDEFGTFRVLLEDDFSDSVEDNFLHCICEGVRMMDELLLQQEQSCTTPTIASLYSDIEALQNRIAALEQTKVPLGWVTNDTPTAYFTISNT